MRNVTAQTGEADHSLLLLWIFLRAIVGLVIRVLGRWRALCDEWICRLLENDALGLPVGDDVSRGVSLDDRVPGSSGVDGDLRENRRSEVAEERSSSSRTCCLLLPQLPNDVVESEIWPRLTHTPVLLWNLRRVNRAWRNLVGSSVQWSALELVRINDPSYRHLSVGRRETISSLLQYKIEILNRFLGMAGLNVKEGGDTSSSPKL
ncbi:hypothetical protein R1flu_020905 [Riccia fluitans]|uniref:F-box domain-containing protein n=1 Tax=Riccia fluitans TaxID=41844 RepID=A0ABD1ZP11_9MARC